MLRNVKFNASSASLIYRTITYLNTPILDGQKVVIPRIRKPLRGGQNLSERYKRLERSLRGKESYSKELETLIHSNPDAYSISSQSNSRRQGKTTQLFHGFVIPEEPKVPADDECCMSGCAVCVYDLYEEALESYQEALSNLRTNLIQKNIPEGEWPQSIRIKHHSSSPDSGAEKRKDVILSAFEEMERALELKKQKAAAEVDASSNVLKSLQMKKRHQISENMRDAPRDTLLSELYHGLRWILFSSR